jgi:diguanylate cyclase (GGDEF)-like protein/PAS domain S-box-containing protein
MPTSGETEDRIMLSELKSIRARFTTLILTGLLIAPLAGLASALLFGLFSASELQSLRTLSLLAVFMTTTMLWAFTNFYHYFSPLSDWSGRTPATCLTAIQQRRLAGFSRDYWAFLLFYALAMPVLLFIAAELPIASAPGRFLQLLLLQLSVALLVGLPTYQLALDLLGKLAGHLSLQKIQVSLKSKIMLLGGIVPLLSYSVLINYHWQQNGAIRVGDLAIWLTLVMITGMVTLFSIRSVTRALAPVQDIFQRSGASMHADLARLSPQSMDEIGFITQTLGKLFRRLGEQETHMRVVVETAAEGIIVINSKGLVETFNPAAEKLFGYLATEICHRPFKWLLPELVDDENGLRQLDAECEVQGYHRNGAAMQMSARISPMHINGQCLYTCLVADITRRKATEAQLRDAENRYRDLVETAHDLVWTMDAAGELTYVNRACLTIYGFEPEDMLQRSFHEFRSPDHPPVDQEAIDELRQGRDRVKFETVHLDAEGKPHFLSFSAKSHKNADGRVIQISGTARDVTEQKAFQHQLSYHAEHDSLTGLFNRNYFQQELERTVARVARNDSDCALFYFDLDQFKYINDTLGHAAGDRLLVDVAALLSSHVRDGDLLARFGGDEFTLLLYSIDKRDVLSAAENFRALCDDFKFVEAGRSFSITSSIGVAMIDCQVKSAEEVLSHADLACNIAKQQGRNRSNLFNPADRDKAGMAADMGWAARVREMLEHDRFQLVYQPIVSTQTGRVKDYEVLVRMICDDGQIILPGGFMPAAERFGLIHSVDRWIVRRAIRQLSHLHEKGMSTSFSINLSGKAFEDATLLPLIQEMLSTTGLDPTWVTFEITETAAIENLVAAEEFITALKDIGCQFALDDFGSGFSSFAYLKHLPVDKLKIDGGFVKGMAHSSVDQAMVESMNQVAHALGKVTIAECVENERTLQILKQMGVDCAQGNHVGRPREILTSLAQSAPVTLGSATQHG